MKKIVVFSNMYPSSEHPTYGIFVKNQVELLKKSGLVIEVKAIDNPIGGKFQSLLKYGKWFASSVFYLIGNRQKISLTHAHYAFPTGLLSLIGKRLFHLPYVVTVHGGDIDKMAKKGARIAGLTRTILQEATHVITVGERLKQEVVTNFGVSETNVTVMSMGVDRSVFHPLPRAVVRDELGLPVHDPTILFIGNLIREKGVLELVQSFATIQKKLPEVSLHLIGSTKSEAFVEEVKQYITIHQIEGTHFQGTKTQKELAKWLAGADVLALPSYHEGFGLVALEAMAAGTPVVASDVGGLSYLLVDGAGILVPAREVEGLSQGLLQALSGDQVTNVEKREQIVHAHSYEMILEKLLKIYGETEYTR
ncbi:glycosyltransferase family 4 protein [Sporosarcina sp. BI001-red]|uniref:glycosyltransferase n=1 Tax=Sporosarcina sp. BI001-red TaxID=2282866 RepID=UPI000E2814FB|nr:glycosyltransferase [Sporosarcina sp. BI001-red]REB08813.1 glycosyltransferase family 4 protein [Sporosarcina sp. BI001-red]